MNLKNDEKREMRLDSFLVSQLLIGFSIANACFLLGFSLHSWQFWLSMSAAVALAFLRSLKTGLWMVGLNALMFLLTLYTFTYVHVDASICHLPITHFIQDGWNPVRESSFQAIRECFERRGVPGVDNFSVFHIIAAPKFSHILAAQMQSALDLFSANGYALWFMCFALCAVAYRFSVTVFKKPRWVSAAFAALVASNVILAEACFWGLVDYVSYSAIAISAMSLRMWLDTKSREDLYLFFACAVVALATKMNSIACIVLLLAFAAVSGRKEKDMRTGLLLFLASLAFFCVIPYWTSAWCHGSPLYPAHSFYAGVPTADLNGDFVGNDDSCRMGYVSRMVYAWVAKSLAVWGCRIWHSLDSFDPRWKWEFLSGGQGPVFCFLLWIGAGLSVFVNRNRTTLVAWVLMVAFLLVPVKYIGYSRYVSFVFFVIVLFWFNILAALPLRARFFGYSVSALFACCVALRCGAIFMRQVRGEGIRQKNIEKIAECGDYNLDGDPGAWEYVIRQRLQVDGAAISSQGSATFCVSWPLVLSGPRLLERDESVWWTLSDGFPRPVRSTRCGKGVPNEWR